MEEIEAIKVISEKLEKLSEEERARVLAWANAKYGGKSSASASQVHSTPTTSSAKSANVSKQTGGKAKGPKKAKSVITMDKTLNLSPSGKPSANDRSLRAQPSARAA